MFQLKPAIQNYAWGKIGSTSKVASLASSSDFTIYIDEDQPYAELWLGTHVNGPGMIEVPNESTSKSVKLSDHFQANPHLMGDDKTCNLDNGEESGQLPYLMKVLSVAKALSIQAHPDKALARKLHAEKPSVYRDANHKPEMAIALTNFEAMCGFRECDEIALHIKDVSELRTIIGDEVCENFLKIPSIMDAITIKESLKKLFGKFVTAPEHIVSSALKSLIEKLKSKQATGTISGLESTILRISSEFPGDVGAFAPYLLNVVHLTPGQSIYLGANEPHAYLKGDIVEVMACSDNVVRAGLTPKLKDIDILLSMLTYKSMKVIPNSGKVIDEMLTLYEPNDPAVNEFVVERYSMDMPGIIYHTTTYNLVSIFLVVSGKGIALFSTDKDDNKSGVNTSEYPLIAGSSFVQCAGVSLQLKSVSDEHLIVYRVHRRIHV